MLNAMCIKCKDSLEYSYTRDTALPYGEISSEAIFVCTECGAEYSEEEIWYHLYKSYMIKQQ